MVVHAFNPRTQETEAGGPRVPGQPGIYNNTLSKIKRKKGKKGVRKERKEGPEGGRKEEKEKGGRKGGLNVIFTCGMPQFSQDLFASTMQFPSKL
jgi:hypothetical protein